MKMGATVTCGSEETGSQMQIVTQWEYKSSHENREVLDSPPFLSVELPILFKSACCL